MSARNELSSSPAVDGLLFSHPVREDFADLVYRAVMNEPEVDREVYAAEAYLRKGYVAYDSLNGAFNEAYNEHDSYHVAVVFRVSKQNSHQAFDELAAVQAEMLDDRAANDKLAAEAKVEELEAALAKARKNAAKF